MKITTEILIVDDNTRALQALTACLSLQPGLRICAQASNGLEAIHAIQRRTPDVVLLDVEMPVMDGLEATRIIKKRWPNVKVLVLTMYPTHRSQALAAGADGFLVKGCSLFEVVAAIHALTEQQVALPVCE